MFKRVKEVIKRIILSTADEKNLPFVIEEKIVIEKDLSKNERSKPRVFLCSKISSSKAQNELMTGVCFTIQPTHYDSYCHKFVIKYKKAGVYKTKCFSYTYRTILNYDDPRIEKARYMAELFRTEHVYSFKNRISFKPTIIKNWRKLSLGQIKAIVNNKV
jgi:hypothetical protein